jgi:uncharacterized membrane protein
MSPGDWPIRNCLILCFALFITTVALIGLGAVGLDIPVLRQIVAFVFISLVPGILLLRILRIHNVHIIESLLYSVGLSLAFAMAVGVVANFGLPPIGISRPIALLPLLLIITPALVLLCLLAYIRDKDFRPSKRRDDQAMRSIWRDLRANPAPYLLAFLLPLLAILGANLVNIYYNNTLIFALIFVIIVIIGLAAFNRFIHPRVYPFIIFMMALALLYQTTFISGYLVGSDIHVEYYVGNLVVENGYWDANTSGGVNSCLSIVILAPVYSLLLNMDIVWLFKIVNPLLFCLVPLALFRVFSLQIKAQYAFLAVVFFISMPMFFMDMTQLGRQQVSELFFVLVVLLMVDRKLTLVQRTILVLIFGFGVIVSYYGLGTAYPIAFLAFGSLVLIFIKSRPGRTLWQRLIGKTNSLPADLTSTGAFNKKALAVIVIVTLIFMFVYAGVTSAGLTGPRIASGILQDTAKLTARGITTPPITLPAGPSPAVTPYPGTVVGTPSAGALWAPKIPGFIQNITARFPFLNPLTKEPLSQTALGLDFPWASTGGKVWRIFQCLVELCLIIGFFRLIFRPGSLGKLKAEYISLTIVSALILLGIYILPTTGYGMGSVRIFGITLLLMSPLFLFGGELIGYGLVKLGGLFRRRFVSLQSLSSNPVPLQFLVLAIMIPYFIFNSGAVFELSKSQTTYFIDMPYSISLSSYRLDLSTVFAEQDIVAANWLSAVSNHNIHADIHSCQLFYTYHETQDTGESASSSCIYLRSWNTRNEVWTVGTAYAARQSISFDDLPGLKQSLENGDKIYDNGEAKILLVQ